jgi:peroxiredoxin
VDPLTLIDRPAPLFRLSGIDGRTYALEEQRGNVVILNFWSAECPWSERADRLLSDYRQAWGEQVVVWTIAANENEGLAMVRRQAAERHLRVVLRDEKNRVADLYGAQTTPHFFVIDGEGVLRYQGALDDVTFRVRQPTREFLRPAVETVLAGRRPDPALTPGYGCAILRHLG